jgi:hypothetical protein
MVAIHRFSTPNGLREVAQGPSVAVSRKGLSMAVPADSGQLATHPRHGRGKGPAGIK